MIQKDNILESSYWPERVRVVSVKTIGKSYTKIEAVGLNTNKFYDHILTEAELKTINIYEEKPFLFSANGELFFLFIESQRIRNAFQFDPLYAISVSQIDPLPHQIEAVYHYIMQNSRIRFLLADDPGAGKTIIAGLVIKELKYRGLIERVLIIAPGHLKDQWKREMKEKFQENFIIIDRSVMNAAWGQNIFDDKNLVIISLDFAKQDNVMNALKDTQWDLCIVDEAHKMSAYKYGEKVSKTQRYNLGELLSSISKHLLFLTATPHRGDPENFRLLLELLEPDFFANKEILSEAIQNKENPLFLRRLKEDLKDSYGAPIFPPRNVETVKYYLSDDEKMLYNAVTEYVEKHFNKALEKEKRNVAFALTILQRRLASSVRAIRKSLEKRYARLNELYNKGQLIPELDYDEENLEDFEENERWNREEELLEKLTSADTLDELWDEIEKVGTLVELAKEVEKKEIETKLNELKRVMSEEKIRQIDTNLKLLIFTEAKDTLEYLVEKLNKWGYSVTFIHGGMNMDARIQAEAEFKNNAQIMVSTEAGGEGINLQFCWLMVNYDIPWNPNRLEQRMGRIHRYGQRHEVHIYNMVAVDTREGRILERLFNKLSQIQEHLGSDRVFDVIGEVLAGKSLKDLIVDAIANRRTMEDILKDFEGIPDEEAIRKVREASQEALATRHIDLARIQGEEQKARENRLVPEYVEEFFKRAAKLLDIKMEKREAGIWRIASVPLEIRNQPYKFKINFGEVQREYAKISFDKEKASKNQAEFVAMGHPLLESILNHILTRFADLACNGATFNDPEGKRNGIIWFLEAEIRDGKNEVAGKRLFAVYQNLGIRNQELANRLQPDEYTSNPENPFPISNISNLNSKFSFVDPAILWDLKPMNVQTDTTLSNSDFNEDDIIEFVITEGLENYKKELLERRRRDAEIKRKYGIRSLEVMIENSEVKLIDYNTRRAKGENIPDVTILNEERRKEDFQRKKERLEKEIEAEIHLSPTEPKILGAVRVIPNEVNTDMASDFEIEQIGMKVAIEYEINQGRKPEDVSLQNLGFDICSIDNEGKFRYIEVKARAKEGPVALTPNEWFKAQRLKEEYWLYIIVNAASNPQLYITQNPSDKLRPNQEFDIVKYVVNDWKENAILVM